MAAIWADDLFKFIFFDEKVWILIKISLKFVSKGPINQKTALVQIMACRLFSEKPLEPTMLWFIDAFIHHLASMS